MTVLRLWFLGTLALVVGALIWAFVPVLVPMIALTIWLGGLVWVIVAVARWFERRREQR